MNFLKMNESDFMVPWWYRTVLAPVPRASAMQRVLLEFDGITYRANVFLNGVLVANASVCVGTFRYFSFDVTTLVRSKSANVVAVQVFRPLNRVFGKASRNTTDLTNSFVDWSPHPPDQSTGLWRAVRLRVLSGAAALSDPFVETRVAPHSFDANVEFGVRVRNVYGGASLSVTVRCAVPSLGLQLSAAATVPPASAIDVVVGNASLTNARSLLWWPWQVISFVSLFNIIYMLNKSTPTDGRTNDARVAMHCDGL